MLLYTLDPLSATLDLTGSAFSNFSGLLQATVHQHIKSENGLYAVALLII